MSRTEYYLDFVSMPLLILWLLALTNFWWPAFIAGYFLWTIAEYVIHRFLFHRVPWFKEAHDTHHEHPSGYTGVSSFQSLSIFVGLCVLVVVGILPGCMLAGFTTGYLVYIVTHHMIHHWEIPPGDCMYSDKMRHRMHHNGEEVNFGVVTTLWDHVFGTYKRWPNRLH